MPQKLDKEHLLWAEGLAHYLNGFGSPPDRGIQQLVDGFLQRAPARELRRRFNALGVRWPVHLGLELVPSSLTSRKVDHRISKGDPIAYRVEPEGGAATVTPTTRGPIHVDALLWLWRLMGDANPRLRRCPECATYFVDQTRNGSQRFCKRRCASRATSRKYRAEGKEREARRLKRVTRLSQKPRQS